MCIHAYARALLMTLHVVVQTEMGIIDQAVAEAERRATVAEMSLAERAIAHAELREQQREKEEQVLELHSAVADANDRIAETEMRCDGQLREATAKALDEMQKIHADGEMHRQEAESSATATLEQAKVGWQAQLQGIKMETGAELLKVKMMAQMRLQDSADALAKVVSDSDAAAAGMKQQLDTSAELTETLKFKLEEIELTLMETAQKVVELAVAKAELEAEAAAQTAVVGALAEEQDTLRAKLANADAEIAQQCERGNAVDHQLVRVECLSVLSSFACAGTSCTAVVVDNPAARRMLVGCSSTLRVADDAPYAHAGMRALHRSLLTC